MKKGFTVVELMVSIGILTVLFALTTINITRLPSSAAQSSSYDRLVSDLRGQQSRAMSGYNGESYGIYFENTSYTLFTGTSYATGTEYFKVDLDPNLTFTSDTFSGAQVVFTAGSGDSGVTVGSDSVSITNSGTNDVKILKINKYGATY
jgi:prepilin-type N-terminal cleavage/methylation domain-containing protein